MNPKIKVSIKDKITLCIDPNCPHGDCRRNVVARNIKFTQDREMFFDSPREEGQEYCQMLWTEKSDAMIDQLEQIMTRT